MPHCLHSILAWIMDRHGQLFSSQMSHRTFLIRLMWGHHTLHTVSGVVRALLQLVPDWHRHARQHLRRQPHIAVADLLTWWTCFAVSVVQDQLHVAPSRVLVLSKISCKHIMGSECVLTADQLEQLTSGDMKSKLPSLHGKSARCSLALACSSFCAIPTSVRHASLTLVSACAGDGPRFGK